MASEHPIEGEPSAGLDGRSPSVFRRLGMAFVVLLVALLLLAVLEQGWGNNFGNRERLLQHLEAIHANRWAPVLLVLVFVVCGLLGLPLKVILVGATVVMGPWVALGTGYVGTHLSALSGFAIGRRYGKPLLKRLRLSGVRRLNARLHGDEGIAAVLLARLVPMAPFFIINLAAGASGLRFHSFNLGTLLGIAPGIGAWVLLTHRLEALVTRPDWKTVAAFAAILAGVVAAVIYVHRTLWERTCGE